MRQIEIIHQSKSALALDDKLEVMVTVVSPLASGIFNKGEWQPWFDLHSNGRGCILVIKNSEDRLCLARCIVLGRSRLHREDSPEAGRLYKTILEGDHGRQTKQKKEALKLMADAGLEEHEGNCGLPEVKKIQLILPDYQLKIFDKGIFNGLLYKGLEDKEKVIAIYLHDGHYLLITSVSAFFGLSHYCQLCDKAFSDKDSHRCKTKCLNCHRIGKGPCIGTEQLHCLLCNQYFNNTDCFEQHLKVSSIVIGKKDNKRKIPSSICRHFFRCEKCNKLIRVINLRGEPHNCEDVWCSVCCKFMEKGHVCFMQKIADRPKKKKEPVAAGRFIVGDAVIVPDGPTEEETEEDREREEIIPTDEHPDEEMIDKDGPRFIFWDVEMRQETVVGQNANGPIYRHEPNFVAVLRACDTCYGQPIDVDCIHCGARKHLFRGLSCLDDFCTWLFTEENSKCIAFAHNSSGFDSTFVLNWLQHQAIRPEIIMRGLSIILCKTSTVCLKDSLMFIPSKLADFPKTFNLVEKAKGHFTFLFNKLENDSYVGPYPPIEVYCPGQMKEGDYEKFLTWYKKKVDSGEVYDHRKQLEAYCLSDVDILMAGCMKFRSDFIATTTVCPFTCSNTIAGACSYMYRKLFLPANKIALCLEGGYCRSDQQSTVALKWLKYLEETENMTIQHKLNGGERRIGQYLVDGFIDRAPDQRPLVLEFNGKILPNGLTAEECYSRTLDRRHFLEQTCEVREKWEHELSAELRADKQMKKWFDTCEIVDVLNPRHCLQGGRTGAAVLYHKTEPGEKVDYLDICSLYPSVNYYGAYPTGKPKIITSSFETLTASHQPYKGLIKCTVLAPRRLMHPLLGRRVKSKLLFGLCRHCMDTSSQRPCSCQDADRQWMGSYCTVEITKALQLGYKVVKIYEVYHYENWMQYDGKDLKTGLFTSYIAAFLKMKQEASGWPAGCDCDEDRDKYIQDYHEKQGILLDKTSIELNPGRRALAKLMLNSFWGKLGQRCNLNKTEYFTDPAAYYSLVTDESNEILQVKAVTDEMVFVIYRKVDDSFVESMGNVSVVHAAYTTALARLKLYSYIEKIPEKNLFYTDTDSVIFSTPAGFKCPIECGPFLGDMVSELPKGFNIVEFCSGGAKQYGYRHNRLMERRRKSSSSFEASRCRTMLLRCCTSKA